MGAPIYNHNDPVRGAVLELASAQSALNMLPEPKCAEELVGLQPDSGDDFFLSRSDKWAEHAYDHISAAADHLYAVQNVMRDVQRIYEILCDPHYDDVFDPDPRLLAQRHNIKRIAARYAAPIAFEERVK